MPSDQRYLDFILEQLGDLEELAYRQMMGEYILYYRGKIAAYICDNRLLVKILPSSTAMLPDARREAPYEGAKEMLMVDRVEDRAFLTALMEKMYPELPAPKAKKKK